MLSFLDFLFIGPLNYTKITFNIAIFFGIQFYTKWYILFVRKFYSISEAHYLHRKKITSNIVNAKKYADLMINAENVQILCLTPKNSYIV